MKKTTRVLLIVAISMILVGGGLSATAWLVTGGDIGVNWKKEEGFVPVGGVVSDSVTLEAFDRMEIVTDYGDIELIPGSREYRVEYAVISSLPEPEISVENGVLQIENHAEIMNQMFGLNTGRLFDKCYFRVYYPADAGLTDVKLDSGMGEVDANGLQLSGTLEVFNAMGDIDLQQVKADRVEVDAAMGEIDCEGLSASFLQVTNSMGDVDVENATLGGLEAELSMGEASFSGRLTGDITVDNDMGSVDIEVDGARADYFVDLETNMGEKRLNGSKYSVGDAGNPDAANRITVSSSMGEVQVDFQR